MQNDECRMKRKKNWSPRLGFCIRHSALCILFRPPSPALPFRVLGRGARRGRHNKECRGVSRHAGERGEEGGWVIPPPAPRLSRRPSGASATRGGRGPPRRRRTTRRRRNTPAPTTAAAARDRTAPARAAAPAAGPRGG